MRHDMFKVIVERPRRGGKSGRQHEARFAKKFQLDEELEVADQFCVSKLTLRPRNDWRKSLNENLSPLRRFLHRSVGRPWDSVYSEICKNLDAKSTVKQHVRDHLTDFVHLHVQYEGEEGVYVNDSWGVNKLYPTELYVDRYGILKKVPGERKRWRNVAPIDPNVKVISKTLRFMKINDVWFKVEFADLSTDQLKDHVYNTFKKDALGIYILDCPRHYKDKIYAVKKSTASKKDLKEIRS